ncbi:poly-beta-1,6-N-acetyl-D-glucosamine biosynthesis protein PgaD [Polymorphobacter fuscus]|uniref:Poly-beta-1,6-N-acetyl-D-glucosamine biosynthesis protein PgaD n=1 Tax=Sandarakinorhabdus fusca TaxID=1439888 RepID=A0A7C9GX37_9SPHN|nr:poly-beta-1,6-N-acetyl-D-glucosamine biosynthesis protein PgaD [Polymorphobacter fuscus]KAB7644481.1 poly-beta-1,6-N-acetyl-D-glucosamine biosynthesis protein PgaD [Polymorphobacter fuscus]MQT18409.1 poly-beta-1,6-N-acetyl-D-glucosamine biosynthesis protein PgaD [Polymorphobacter fuscus]NJC08309.1 poly-beta-1,6-N-acetyl-D-glucosamine biosynthesis protein PgaD [Polymorphobacter fuscus]
MTSLIINLPHLQSRRQRHGALLLSLLCWAWFVMPLVIVGGWLMGLPMAQEVVWLGGWQSLVRLAGIAATIVVALLGVWAVWTLVEIRSERRPGRAPAATAVADFGIDAESLAFARAARLTTVYFTQQGSVADIVIGVPTPVVPIARQRAA